MKKRRKLTPTARMRPYWILWLLGLLLVACGLYLLASWDALKPHSVTVQGNKLVGTEAIVEAAGVDLHRNMWLQSIGAMQTRVEAIPYIDLARVHRFLPSSIVIEVAERVPVAVVQASNGSYLVDARERVLQEAPADAKLPVLDIGASAAPKIGGFFFNDDVMHLLNDMGALTDAHITASTFAHDKYGDLTVQLRSGVRVLFGDENDIEKKIPLIQPILDQVAKQKKQLVTIDVRSANAPVVIYKK